MGPAQIHRFQQRVAGHWHCQPPVFRVLTDLGDQVGGHELAQGDLHRG
ncbi:MAG TPA: hypothetical protein VJ140_18545 [Actinomycetota bacterium]|nr:hypothetical protein [Actinomycetota bacterium]